jgi:hypothetical protein
MAKNWQKCAGFANFANLARAGGHEPAGGMNPSPTGKRDRVFATKRYPPFSVVPPKLFRNLWVEITFLIFRLRLVRLDSLVKYNLIR